MDQIDLDILKLLERDGRVSFAALGEAVGISKTPAWNRVKDLESKGVIDGFGARVDPEAIGLHIRALVHLVVAFDQYEAFEAAIVKHPNISTCHAVTGEYDYVLEILASDMNALDRLLRTELSRLPGVTRFNTSITTRMIKSGSSYSGMVTTKT